MEIRQWKHNVGEKKKSVIERVSEGIPWIEPPSGRSIENPAVLKLHSTDHAFDILMSKAEWDVLKDRMEAAFVGENPNGPFAGRYKDIYWQEGKRIDDGS